MDLSPYFNRNGIVSDGGALQRRPGRQRRRLLGPVAPPVRDLQWRPTGARAPRLHLPGHGRRGGHRRAERRRRPGQVIDLPPGQFNTLTFLGCGVFGAQQDQVFTVTYSDGSQQTFTQSLSDWFHSSGFSGETVVASTPYFDKADGTTQAGTYDLYGYSFTLDKQQERPEHHHARQQQREDHGHDPRVNAIGRETMNDDAMTRLERRIATLEIANRRWRRFAACAAIGLACLGVMGARLFRAP